MISVNCEWNNWEPYTECIGICGTGTRNRTRRIKVHADHGGLDCVGNFTQFDNSCTILDKPCPGKYYKHHLPVDIYLQKKKIDCKLKYISEPISDCLEPCEVSEWYDFGKCDQSCGGGYQKQVRDILLSGANCPHPDDMIRFEICNTEISCDNGTGRYKIQ